MGSIVPNLHTRMPIRHNSVQAFATLLGTLVDEVSPRSQHSSQ